MDVNDATTQSGAPSPVLGATPYGLASNHPWARADVIDLGKQLPGGNPSREAASQLLSGVTMNPPARTRRKGAQITAAIRRRIGSYGFTLGGR